jgi:hypothetical protein
MLKSGRIRASTPPLISSTGISRPGCGARVTCCPGAGAWPVMKNHLGNLAPGTTSQLAAAMRHQLDRIQRQPSLIAGFLGQTGLTLETKPP